MNKVNERLNIFNDGIGFVEQYDFSTANMSEENRIKAITTVASICYQNPKAIGSESLYNRLLAESKGLPSSSFEFVPVLFDFLWIYDYFFQKSDMSLETSNILKYGELIYVDGTEYLLTNYRALIYDVENMGLSSDILKHFNTTKECEIIKEHFKVFLYKVDLPTRSQMVRHRVSWQELSRRYVSGKRVPFDFYVSEKMKNLKLPYTSLDFKSSTRYNISTEDFLELSVALYEQAIKDGIKPQEARRILPQGLYTEIWGAYQPKQLDNFFKLRLDKSAQKEIRLVAEAMDKLIKGD